MRPRENKIAALMLPAATAGCAFAMLVLRAIVRTPSRPCARNRRVCGMALDVVDSIAALMWSANKEGLQMRMWIAIGMLMATTVAASAATVVPEIDAFSGLAAMGLIGSIGALIWERTRKK
jgi:hypothetical protein